MAKGVTTWMPIFIGDHLSETSSFDTLEHGAYILLLMRLWQFGELPDDERFLSRVTKVSLKKWRMISGNVLSNFTRSEGKLSHSRLSGEMEKARRNLEQKSAAGKASGNARKPPFQSNGRSPAVPTSDATEFERQANGWATASEPRAGEGEGGGIQRGSTTSLSTTADHEDYDDIEWARRRP